MHETRSAELFFGLLAFGGLSVIVLRLASAASRSPSKDDPAAEYSVSGRLRVPKPPVDVTPRASAADPLLQQLFATAVNPYDPVSTVMVPRAEMVTARAMDTVASISPALERFTGVAVVADDCPTRVRPPPHRAPLPASDTECSPLPAPVL